MTDAPSDRKPRGGLAVPQDRASRLLRFGGMAAGVAGEMAVRGAAGWMRGERPAWRDLLLTPSNVARFTEQLSKMRGAAMKVGQLLSMEAGEILPPELSEILARLRQDAHPMPSRQLKSVLVREWGADFLKKFERFDVAPIAAASIGQVHRGKTRDGRDLAVKLQYPGVRASIDSDVDNVAALIRLSGLAPPGLDLAPLMAEAKQQLHQEADYRREARYLERFGALLADDPDFLVPRCHADFSTENVLAMDFIASRPIEALESASQPIRDRAIACLFRLFLAELFDFQLMQTDPNFANYRTAPGDGDSAPAKIILLDFGAAREIPHELVARYRALLAAGLARDEPAMMAAAADLGFYGAETPPKLVDGLRRMLDLAMGPLRHEGAFDFGAADVLGRMRDVGLEMAEEDPDASTIPPIDALFIQRKIAGMFLLATRLRARVAVRPMLEPYLTPAPSPA